VPPVTSAPRPAVPSVSRLASQVFDSLADRLALDDVSPDTLSEVRIGAAARRWMSLYGAILFESRANLERVRLLTEGTFYLTLHFELTDAALPELLRLAPVPALAGELAHVLGQLRRVGLYQQSAIAQPAAFLNARGEREFVRDETLFHRAGAFARDARDKGLVDRFNRLIRVGSEVGGIVFGDLWNDRRPSTLPAEVDPAQPTDHSMV
jgi:hypothetical protein